MKKCDFTTSIDRFVKTERVSFHMPGHKGRINLLGSEHDLTELDGTDNLYSPVSDGALEVSLKKLRKIYGTKATVVTSGGATLAINAAIHSVLRKRCCRKVLSERNIHRSVVYSFSHCDADPVWIPLSDGIRPTTNDIISAIRSNPDCVAVVLTSPDYYGRMHDINAIAAEAQKYGMTIIVDGAHGAHLDFWQDGAMSSVGTPGVVTAQSLHKTLPALTGSAVLHSSADITEEELLFSVQAFGSTSPSYLISLSAFSAVDYMLGEGAEKLSLLFSLIQKTKEKLSLYGVGFYDGLSDPFRLVFTFSDGVTAGLLSEHLISDGIYPEFYDRDNLVLIPSVMNNEDDFSLLWKSAGSFFSCHSAITPDRETGPNIDLPEGIGLSPALSVHSAMMSPWEWVDTASCAGRISAEPVSLYPPGTAILMPGELIRAEFLPYLTSIGISHIKVVK